LNSKEVDGFTNKMLYSEVVFSEEKLCNLFSITNWVIVVAVTCQSYFADLDTTACVKIFKYELTKCTMWSKLVVAYLYCATYLHALHFDSASLIFVRCGQTFSTNHPFLLMSRN
jgi:hypothetical protein